LLHDAVVPSSFYAYPYFIVDLKLDEPQSAIVAHTTASPTYSIHPPVRLVQLIKLFVVLGVIAIIRAIVSLVTLFRLSRAAVPKAGNK
jgi:hypothetical protein